MIGPSWSRRRRIITRNLFTSAGWPGALRTVLFLALPIGFTVAAAWSGVGAALVVLGVWCVLNGLITAASPNIEYRGRVATGYVVTGVALIALAGGRSGLLPLIAVVAGVGLVALGSGFRRRFD